MNPSCSSLILCLVFPVAFHALSQIASKEKISQMKYFVSYRRYAYLLWAVSSNVFGQDACADVSKEDS